MINHFQKKAPLEFVLFYSFDWTQALTCLHVLFFLAFLTQSSSPPPLRLSYLVHLTITRKVLYPASSLHANVCFDILFFLPRSLSLSLAFLLYTVHLKLQERRMTRSDLIEQNEMREIKLQERAYNITIEDERKRKKNEKANK